MKPTRATGGSSCSWRQRFAVAGRSGVVAGQHLIEQRWAHPAEHLRRALPVGLQDGGLPSPCRTTSPRAASAALGSSGIRPCALKLAIAACDVAMPPTPPGAS